jgi:hypothetical protein
VLAKVLCDDVSSMKLSLLFAFALVSLVAPAKSQAVSVLGDVNCGMWLDARTKRASIAFEAYLQGLLNGISIGSGVEFWKAKQTTLALPQVLYWMDNYCRTRPLSNVHEGAKRLIDERAGLKAR